MNVDRQSMMRMFSELCEGQLTLDGLAQLEPLLLTDPKALAEYVAYLDIHTGLDWQLSSTRPVPSAMDRERSPIIEEVSPARSNARVENRFVRHPMTSSFGVATAVTAAMLLVMAIIPLPQRKAVTVGAKKPAEPVASITRTARARWAEGAKMRAGRELRPGSRLLLTSGLAEVLFFDGTTVMLEGPAKLQIDSLDRTTLDLGQLRAYVPPEADGFVVETPDQTITDLGTEFGVSVDERGVSEVHVFAGSVSTLAKNVEGAEEILLTKNQSVRFDATGAVASTGAAISSRFAKTFPAARPLHQWTFNEGSLEDSVGNAHGTLHGGAQIVDGRLVLDGVDDYFRSAPLEGKITAKTLVAWVELANLMQRSGSALTLEDHPRGEVFDAIVYAEKHPRQWIAGSNVYSRTLEDNVLEAAEAEDSPEQTMMAIVYSPNNVISVYRNGRLVSRYTKGTLQSYEAKRAEALIGLRHGSIAGRRGSPEGNDGYLAGAVNEARIYDRPLSAQHIYEMYVAGPVKAGPEKTDDGKPVDDELDQVRHTNEEVTTAATKP